MKHMSVYSRIISLGHLARPPLAARLALWGGREIVALTVVSLVAGTATIPYVAYHFHRASPYGVLANLAAMPVVSGWVMPWGIVGLLSMPLGLDLPCWRLMGLGIELDDGSGGMGSATCLDRFGVCLPSVAVHC
jgi:predicted membrane metal-binding protein